MALKPIYEGIPAGEVELNSTDLSTAANTVTAGMLCQIDSSETVTTGSAADGYAQASPCYGIVADDKDDIIASGKVTVYITPGKYATDQYTATPALNAVIAMGSDGKLKAVASGDMPAGYITKAASDGWIEFMFHPGLIAAS